MAQHNILGKWGEDIACQKLIIDGYAIVERNWRCSHYEVDIIAMKGDRIVFVEVKTRQDDFVDPIDAINRRKILNIVRSADAYIRMKNIPHQAQFDIISIIGTPENYKLEHIPDAFDPPLMSR
jgi:putative endonuclease